jgi:dihydrofolate reductase
MADMTVTVYIATSLDGFIARSDGALDWLDHAADGPNEDYGYAAFMKTVDALVMGRLTYEAVRGLGAWPYGKKPVVVLTGRKVDIPRDLAKTVTTMSGNVDAIIGALAARGMTHLYVDGGVTIQKFLNAGAIQRLILTRIPILIGTGLPLFGRLDRGDLRLTHVQTRVYASGLVQSEYEVPTAKRRPSRKSRATKARKP